MGWTCRGGNRTHSRRVRSLVWSALCALILSLLPGCAKDTDHALVVSTADQKMLLLEKGRPIATYSISTSKFGLGDRPGSNYTPLGRMEIAQKVGGGAPAGAVFKNREQTGEVVGVDAPGRDPIVSRILWLKGLEPQNQNAFERTIYIHGTPEERNIGLPVSYGCVRMRSADVMQLFSIVGWGAQVYVSEQPLEQAAREFNGASLPMAAR